MKNSKLIFVIAFFISVITSCELINTGSDDTGKELEVNQENICGKWMVTNTNSIYKSFEFTESGICIVVESTSTKSNNNENVKVGKYDFDDLGYGLLILFEGGSTYVLDEILLTDKDASFSITKQGDPDSEVLVETEKAEEIEESKNTKLLAKSWLISSSSFYTSDGELKIQNFPDYNIRFIVSFTSYGTFTTFASQNGEETRKYGNWMWNDSNETTFKAWENGQSSVQAEVHTIVELTENIFVYSTVSISSDGENPTITMTCIPEPSGYYW